jgi:hypothetical protein
VLDLAKLCAGGLVKGFVRLFPFVFDGERGKLGAKTYQDAEMLERYLGL